QGATGVVGEQPPVDRPGTEGTALGRRSGLVHRSPPSGTGPDLDGTACPTSGFPPRSAASPPSVRRWPSSTASRARPRAHRLLTVPSATWSISAASAP